MTYWETLTSKRWVVAQTSKSKQTVGSSIFDMNRQLGHGVAKADFCCCGSCTAHPGRLTAPSHSITLALLIMACPRTFGGAHLIQSRAVLVICNLSLSIYQPKRHKGNDAHLI